MKIPFIFIFIILFTSLFSQVNKDTLTSKKHFFINTGAPSMYTGISYERLVYCKNKFDLLPRIGMGFNIFKPSLGKEFNFQTGITTLYGGIRHKAERGLGVIHYFVNQYDFEREKNGYQYNAILYGLIGYRFSFKKNPLSLKLAFTPIFVINSDIWTFFPLAEFGIGFRIK